MFVEKNISNSTESVGTKTFKNIFRGNNPLGIRFMQEIIPDLIFCCDQSIAEIRIIIKNPQK